jgi:hypothetical protein
MKGGEKGEIRDRTKISIGPRLSDWQHLRGNKGSD